MPNTQFGTGLEKIRDRRRLSLEVILIAVALAFVIEIFSSFVLNALTTEGGHFRFWCIGTWFTGLALFIAISVAILFILSKKETETGDLALTLAIHVDPIKGQVKFLPHKHYQPASTIHELFSRANDDLKQQFLNAWPGPNPLKEKAFGPGHFCWDTIEKLVKACLIVLIQKYSETSLTHAAQFYAEFRQLAGRIPSKKLEKERWPISLQANDFLIARGVQKLIVPESARLRAVVPKHIAGEKPGTRELTISTDYGALTFSISPYWTILRNYERAITEFSPPEPDRICFLRIPIDLRLEIRGFHFSFLQMTYHYMWFQKLAENARRRLDWGLYLRGRGGQPQDV